MSPATDTATRKGVVFRSVDSQPKALSVPVSPLRAPALLLTFALLSLVQLWLFQTGLYDMILPHDDYVFAPYTGEHSIAIRTYIISFFISFAIYGSGSAFARFKFAFDLVLRFLAICAVLDIINWRFFEFVGEAYPLTVVQIIAGLIGFGLFSATLLDRGAMPDAVPVKIGDQQNLRMILRFIAVAVIAGSLAAYVGSLESPVVRDLRELTLLGGIGPGVLLFLPAFFLLLYLIGVVERILSAAKDFSAPISIIVPAFNEAHIIAETIDHIAEAARAYDAPVELLIIDNNSADRTAAIAQATLEATPWVEGRVIKVARPGKAHALNRAVAEARHDFILRIDADTQIGADNIKLAIQNFHDPHVGVVGGIAIPPGGGPFDRARLVEVLLKHGYYAPALSAFWGLIGVPGMFAMYRADALRQAGEFATGMNGEDTDMSLRISEIGYRAMVDQRVRYVSEVPASFAHMREQRMRWFRSVYHVSARAKDALVSRNMSVRGKLVLPYMLLNSARRAMMVPILIFGLFQLLIGAGDTNALVWQSIIAVLVGAPALVAIAAILINREWGALLAMPEYLAFRALRAWYTLESVLSIRIRRSSERRRHPDMATPPRPTGPTGPTGPSQRPASPSPGPAGQVL
ncbi:MAG: glycosyltransferase family 2 protein [Erythrobacter sp.]|nr:glycosyltransferase family 2 protein [Erythrobacter sp.]